MSYMPEWKGLFENYTRKILRQHFYQLCQFYHCDVKNKDGFEDCVSDCCVLFHQILTKPIPPNQGRFMLYWQTALKNFIIDLKAKKYISTTSLDIICQEEDESSNLEEVLPSYDFDSLPTKEYLLTKLDDLLAQSADDERLELISLIKSGLELDSNSVLWDYAKDSTRTTKSYVTKGFVEASSEIKSELVLRLLDFMSELLDVDEWMILPKKYSTRELTPCYEWWFKKPKKSKTLPLKMVMKSDEERLKVLSKLANKRYSTARGKNRDHVTVTYDLEKGYMMHMRRRTFKLGTNYLHAQNRLTMPM